MEVTQGILKYCNIYGITFGDKYSDIKSIVTKNDYNSKFLLNDTGQVSQTSTILSDNSIYYNTVEDSTLINCNIENGRFIGSTLYCIDSLDEHYINDGYFRDCILQNYIINGGKFYNCTIDSSNTWNFGYWQNEDEPFGSDWYDGVWNNGTFNGNWYGGTFNGGLFQSPGVWYDGVANGGTFTGITWHNGLARNANFIGDCEFINGIFNDGAFINSIFYSGNFNGGIMSGSTISGGTIYNGSISDSIVEDGEIKGGVFSNVQINNGDVFNIDATDILVYNGNFHSGDYLNSKFYGGNIYNGIYLNITGSTDLIIHNGTFRTSKFNNMVVEYGNFTNCISSGLTWLNGIYTDGEMYNSVWYNGYWNDGIFYAGDCFSLETSNTVVVGITTTTTTIFSCGAPTLTSLDNTTSNSVDLNFTLITVNDYISWYYVVPGTTVKVKGGDTTETQSYTATISSPIPGEYKFYLKGFCGGGTLSSDFSNFKTHTFISLSIPPSVQINSVSPTSVNSTVIGEVTDDGGATLNKRGVCWSTSINPTISNDFIDDLGQEGVFEISITGLLPSTTYHVRAYARNSVGISYSDDEMFSTNSYASIDTVTINTITDTSASSGGENIDNGGSTVIQKGLVWSTSINPTISSTPGGSVDVDGNIGTGSFISEMTGLVKGTLYYVKAYVTTLVGTSYGEQIEFTTNNEPTITTTDISLVTDTTATSGGEGIVINGSNITEKGLVWSTSPNPTTSSVDKYSITGSDISNFTYEMTGLTNGVTYYVRAYAINSVDIGYGEQKTLTTFNVPTLVTNSISDITYTGATSGGVISNDGGDSVTVKGVCWNTVGSPTISDAHTDDGSGTDSFETRISGLTTAGTYKVRAYATNSIGTGYGDQKTFQTTYCSNTTTLDNIVQVGVATDSKVTIDYTISNPNLYKFYLYMQANGSSSWHVYRTFYPPFSGTIVDMDISYTTAVGETWGFGIVDYCTSEYDGIGDIYSKIYITFT